MPMHGMKKKKGYAKGGATMKKKGYSKGGAMMMKKDSKTGKMMPIKMKMAKGGAMPMAKDPKTGKMIPKFAMDGKGKMASGGMMKKKGMARGGAIRARKK